ncbi:alpha/beta hydrolase [Chondromyces apiculatus]|uniref:Serine aminopeptidase S33 domain-containing protein n=1 Tax=Chondromyces apiculatus DSM 436 TaxID=1192034 RepID=A0A017T4Q0_9BACT|nr:alpha/beta fold hydrolase [Chondromyces apiculatus]EYF04204.1 Hypothetical protein CAP_4681 [Chondromyces apiculatus DSM 436]
MKQLLLVTALLTLYLGASAFAIRWMTMPRTSQVHDPPGSARFLLRTDDGLSLSAVRREPHGVPARGTVVLAHGYGNDRRLLQPLGDVLLDRGFRIVAFDFRAHGESGGDRTTLGLNEARDAAAALDHAARLGGPVGYVGFSMGAAAYLLAGREADAAVLDSPYASLRGALSSRLAHAGLLLPFSIGPIALMSRELPAPIDTVRPVDRSAHLVHPTLFLFAQHDMWVPPEAQAAFRTTACVECQVNVIPGALHAGHFTGPWRAQVTSFLEPALVGSAGPHR